MAQVEQLLKYQSVDAKLNKIEREAASSDEWKNYSQAKGFLTKAPEKLDAMDAKAVEMGAMLEKLNKKYEEIAETLKDFESLDELVDDGADISFYKKNATQLAEKLKSIKLEINGLSKAIKEADADYKALKKKTIAMQDRYKECSAIYQEYKKGKIAEIEAVKAELETLAKDIAPDVLAKYSTKRNERIFPILCAVRSDRCSQCGMELSIAAKEKISCGGVTECDYCHRILYKE